ncbi:hypothetical protein [Pelosinus sp. sgz500959]|uniref:hypothetical protein n=1 Tax=Pelosinus sp. sgz500959 TaxID=3242472 RepID=UPI00366E243D
MMANIYCHDGRCESTHEEAPNMEISDRTIIGVYLLMMIVFTAIVWYEVSIGIYIDPTSLT